MTENLPQLLICLSKDQTLLRSVEEATKQGAVLPVLSELGWSCFNIQEVVPEFSVGNGRVDYCLKLNNKNVVFIEVKRATENLDSHEKQLLEYSFSEGVGLSVLTNGLVWWFYLPLEVGSWQQRKFFTIDIRQQDPKKAAQHFQDFLSRQSLSNGSALKNARETKERSEKSKLFVSTIPKAWSQLVNEHDELFLEMFSNKVESLCGYRPDLEQLTEFLQQNSSQPEIGTTQTNPTPIEEEMSAKAAQKTTKRRGVVVTIDNKTISASSVRDLYLQTLKYLFESNLIDRAKLNIPYATSNVRFLISTDPHHQDGNEFRSPVEYKDYYMEAHKDYRTALNHLTDFLKLSGVTVKEY